jgi:hypothetical protein
MSNLTVASLQELLVARVLHEHVFLAHERALEAAAEVAGNQELGMF